MYTSPSIPQNANKFHESKHEKSTCYNFAGGEALSVARGCLANVLVRIDRKGFSWQEQTPYLSVVDILRARRSTGLLKTNVK